MPLIRKSEAPKFEVPGVQVVGLASPGRGARETCVWHLEVSPGTRGFPHRVTREEVFVAVSGKALATLDGVEHELLPGDALLVPADTPFSLANRETEPFRAVVALPVGGQAVTGEGTFTPPWAV
ncbi:MAG TPA: cupin domain-containing protein [Polyangiaceae bacterium]